MRVSTTKSKNAESFYIVQSFRDSKGKNTTKIVKKLGTLDQLMSKLKVDNRDDVMAWAKEQAEIETKNELKVDKTAVLVPLSPVKQIDLDKKRIYHAQCQ